MSRIAEVEQTLGPGDAWLISIEDATRGSIGGKFSQVPRNQAAKLIVDGRFRAASNEEIAQYEKAARDRAHFESFCPRILYFGRVITLPPVTKKAARGNSERNQPK
jgi:hypothetical protein